MHWSEKSGVLYEMAQALEMNPATLSKFENGGKVTAEDLLDIICFFHAKYNLDSLLKTAHNLEFQSC